jgi:hypothetical protein
MARDIRDDEAVSGERLARRGASPDAAETKDELASDGVTLRLEATVGGKAGGREGPLKEDSGAGGLDSIADSDVTGVPHPRKKLASAVTSCADGPVGMKSDGVREII